MYARAATFIAVSPWHAIGWKIMTACKVERSDGVTLQDVGTLFWEVDEVFGSDLELACRHNLTPHSWPS